VERYAGVWIDHGEAIVVHVTGSGVALRRIESGIERRIHRWDSEHSAGFHEHRLILSENRRESRYRQQLNRFYERVFRAVGEAEAVLLLGPGTARAELRRWLDADRGDQSPAVFSESADRMTDRQLVARVRGFFNRRRRTDQLTNLTLLLSVPGSRSCGGIGDTGQHT
jgi:hypothetical protein